MTCTTLRLLLPTTRPVCPPHQSHWRKLTLFVFSAIAMLSALIRQSTEIQKILAFDGIFEKLFSVVTREGGLEGQSVVTDALKCVDTLLRFNTSNQVKSLSCHPRSLD